MTNSRASRAGSTIELRRVSKSFGAQRVLQGIDLSLAPGELVSLLGPSGCGKTTALRCIAGLEEVSAGQVLIGGEDVTRVPVHQRDVGMVFQQYSLFPHLSVARNVEFGLSMRKVAKPERARRVSEMLDIVGLQDLGDRLPHELSGGQQQRVALARALVTRPRALLLDEPLSALDAKVRMRLRDQIRTIQTELGITTVFVTHDQGEALAMSDRVAVMDRGQIAQQGTPEELYRRPATPFVADFVGLSNQLMAQIDTATDTVSVYGAHLPYLATTSLRQQLTGSAGTVTTFVRPEHVSLQRALPAAEHQRAPLDATVVTSGFLGPIRRTVVRMSDGIELASQHDADTVFYPGDTVRVSFADAPVTVAVRQ